MRLEEVIGVRLTRLREGSQMSQAQLGEGLSGLLEKPWSRQAVSAAEKGRRAFTAAELVSVALAMRVSVAELLLPLDMAEEVELPGGAVLSREEYEAVTVLRDESERGRHVLALVDQHERQLSAAKELLYDVVQEVAAALPYSQFLDELEMRAADLLMPDQLKAIRLARKGAAEMHRSLAAVSVPLPPRDGGDVAFDEYEARLSEILRRASSQGEEE